MWTVETWGLGWDKPTLPLSAWLTPAWIEQKTPPNLCEIWLPTMCQHISAIDSFTVVIYGCYWKKNPTIRQTNKKWKKNPNTLQAKPKLFFFFFPVFSTSFLCIQNFNSVMLANMTAVHLKETLWCLQSQTSINISKSRIEQEYSYCKEKEVQVLNTAAVSVDKSWDLNCNQNKTWPCLCPHKYH